MKNVAIYVRVSTQEQAAEGYSIQEQAERKAKIGQECFIECMLDFVSG